MLRRLLLAGALALTSLVMFAPVQPAFACSCIRADTTQHAARAGAVFTGTITTTRGSGRDLTRQVEYDVAVTDVYKGDVQAQATVATNAHAASCGMPNLPEGTALMFFASTTGGSLTVNACGGTAPAGKELVDGVVAELGEPTSGTPDQQAEQREIDKGRPDPDDSSAVPWVIGGGLFGLGLAAAVAAVRRRRA
jgi:MYXO-CTERM domain-containing protein